MAHTHSVIDADRHFAIDPITRAITNQSEKLVLMQGDHNSEQFTFEIPKTVDGHDMTLCNQVEVHYLNVQADKAEQTEGVYLVSDLTVSSEDENTVIFSWLISGNATKYAGRLNFVVKFKCVADDGTIDYAWNTAIFEGISISDGINNTDAVVEEYADILAEWENRITALENGGAGGGDVDQTFNPDSTNAQSGVAISAEMVKRENNLIQYLIEHPMSLRFYNLSFARNANAPTSIKELSDHLIYDQNYIQRIKLGASSYVAELMGTTSFLVTTEKIDATNKGYILLDTENGRFWKLDATTYELKPLNELVGTIDENSTDKQIPSAKLLYDTVGNIETALDSIITIQENLIGGATE